MLDSRQAAQTTTASKNIFKNAFVGTTDIFSRLYKCPIFTDGSSCSHLYKWISRDMDLEPRWLDLELYLKIGATQ